jgi:rubrerythrin
MLALLAIAKLDMEAAAAYEVAADQAEDRLREMLSGFRDDHRRHVKDLVAFAKKRGMDVQVTEPDRDSSVLAALAYAVGSLEPAAAIEGLVGNELLTNATYETALWAVTDDEALVIVRRNREDERRHLEALNAYAAEHEDEL